MAAGAPPTLRIPMILLAAASLAVLGVQLWPWQEVTSLPGDGTVAFDPAICLLAYIGLIVWISSGIKEPTQKALSAGAMMGLLAGLVLVANVLLGVREAVQSGFLQPALLGVAVILLGGEPGVATPAATVPTPTSETSFTDTMPPGLAHLRS